MNRKVLAQIITPLYQRTFYSWSPDSTQIACTGKKGRKKILTLISVDSGKSELGEGANPLFLPDGKSLLFFTLTNLCILDLNSGQVSELSNFSQRYLDPSTKI